MSGEFEERNINPNKKDLSLQVEELPLEMIHLERDILNQSSAARIKEGYIACFAVKKQHLSK